MRRRRVLACGVALTPLGSALLGACAEDQDRWPDGMVPIKWDRDSCARCSMVISDRRFAAELRGGPRDEAYKFDDIGCALAFRAVKRATMPWLADDDATRFWVAEYGANGERWLDARRAHYVAGALSPMGYDLAAHAAPQPGGIDLEAAHRQVLAAAR